LPLQRSLRVQRPFYGSLASRSYAPPLFLCSEFSSLTVRIRAFSFVGLVRMPVISLPSFFLFLLPLILPRASLYLVLSWRRSRSLRWIMTSPLCFLFFRKLSFSPPFPSLRFFFGQFPPRISGTLAHSSLLDTTSSPFSEPLFVSLFWGLTLTR